MRERIEAVLTPRVALAVAGGLVLVAATTRILLTREIAAPQLLCDEFIYAAIAKSLAADGRFMLRHEPTSLSFVYPALLAPAWWAGSMETAYGLAKAINAIVMTLAAIPFYLWARRLAAPLLALSVTALFLLLPAFNFTALLMTESAFLTAFVLAAFAIASALERPTALRQLGAIAAIGLAVGVRAQAIVLVLVLPTAILFEALLRPREPGRTRTRTVGAALRQQGIALASLGGLGVLYAAVKLAQGNSLRSGIGAYGDVLEADYSVWDTISWAYYHLAELVLAVGVLPAMAFVLVTGLAFGLDRAERCLIAVTLSVLLWLSLEIGAFTSRFAGTVAERYFFYAAPFLLLALAVWLNRGLPRPRLLTAIAALVPAALVLLFPLDRFVRDDPLYSSFGLVPFHRVLGRLEGSTGKLELLVAVAVVLVAVLFVFLPRRMAAVAFPVALAAFFVGSSWPSFGALRGHAFLARHSTGLGADSSWIERELGRDTWVTYLYSEGPAGELPPSRILLQAEFWNRNVRWVANAGPSEICPLPERDGRVDQATGSIEPTAGEEPLARGAVVTDPNVRLAGRPTHTKFPLVVHDAASPLRLSGDFEGLYPDGWIGADAAYNGFEVPSAGSTIDVGVSRSVWRGEDVPGRVVIRFGLLGAGPDGRPRISRLIATRTWVIHSGASRTFSFPAPRGRFRVEINIDPTFVPADFDYPDSRSLGALFNVRVER